MLAAFLEAGNSTKVQRLWKEWNVPPLPCLEPHPWEKAHRIEMSKRDMKATALVPNDVVGLEKQDSLALRSSNDGDCAFHSVSLLLCGDESLSAELKARTIGEGITNYFDYNDDQLLACGLHWGQNQKRNVKDHYQFSGNATPGAKEEFHISLIKEMVKLATTDLWTPLIAFFPLATVIGRPIQLVCPEVQPDHNQTPYQADNCVRMYTHRLVYPKTEDDRNKEPISVIWCGPDPSNRTYTHFAPLVCVKQQGSPSLVGKRVMPHVPGSSPRRKVQKQGLTWQSLSRASKIVNMSREKDFPFSSPEAKRQRVEKLTDQLRQKSQEMSKPPLGNLYRTSDREEKAAAATLSLPSTTPDEKVRGYLELPKSKHQKELFPTEVPTNIEERCEAYQSLPEDPTQGEIFNKMKRTRKSG